jgi:hypothetical protein
LVLSGTNAFGGGGNFGLGKLSICVEDSEYACPSFRISPAASCRTFSLFAAIACSSLDDLLATAAASGSLWAAVAASRFALAPALSRGMEACAVPIASDARVSHFAESWLKSPSARVALARSPDQVRNASAPSPFHFTHCGRTFRSWAIEWISLAAALSFSAAACTDPEFA